MSQSPSTTSNTVPQMTCTVTNNLLLPTHPYTAAQTGWNGEIVAISNTAGSAMETNMDSPKLAAASDFVLLSFVAEDSIGTSTTIPPGNPLPVGKTASLPLPDNTAPTSISENSVPYDLLFVQANNYFPVATIAGVITSSVPADIVLPLAAPHDTSSGANAYRFLQAIMVDPSSPIAQQFTAALLADSNADPQTGSCANVNAFFAQTNDFKDVDFAIYSAVCCYVSAYAFVWANFQPKFTYTIYIITASDSTADADSSASNVYPVPLGTVVFSQLDSCTPPLSDANAGYSITWKPNQGSSIDLNFVEGQLVSQSDGDADAVCLQTAFMNGALFTGQASEPTQACQALIGLINGVHVVGSSLQLDSPAPTDGDDGEGSVPSNDAADAGMDISDIIISVAYIASLVLFLVWVGYKCRQAWNDLMRQQPVEGPAAERLPAEGPSTREIARAKKKIREWDETRLRRQGIAKKWYMNPEVKDRMQGGIDDEDFVFEMQVKEQGQILTLKQAGLEDKELNQQSKEVMNQLEAGNNSAINSEVNNINVNKQQLQAVNLRSPDADESLNKIQKGIDENQSDITSEDKTLKVNTQQQDQLTSKINTEQDQEQEETREENEEKQKANPNFQDDD